MFIFKEFGEVGVHVLKRQVKRSVPILSNKWGMLVVMHVQPKKYKTVQYHANLLGVCIAA